MTLIDRLLGRPEPTMAVQPYVSRGLGEVKAVTGSGVLAYAQDYPLTSLMQQPQEKAAAFLRAYKCGWFYKAESKISGDLATLPWTVTDGDIVSEDPEETNVERPDLDIPFEQLNPIEQFMRLMEKPNPRQTGRQLRQKTFIRRDMAGVAFWYLEAASSSSPITAIYGISPSRLWPAYDRSNQLIGYVLDKDKPSGGTPFEAWEIVAFSNASADDDDIFGVGVVEAVYAELPLTDLMTRHTADLLMTGGRLAGMLWPKERALNEDEFTDAQRAWRNVVSDPASAKRLLLFPEPMEWAPGASTPAEIGIPELAALNRENILTAFPIDPTMLGVPMPSGINASGETRRALQDQYWEGTIQPRSSSFDEVIQTNVLSRYEALMGGTFRYESELPKLDDATSLLEKAGAFRSLIAIGFDPKDTIKAVGLDHIKWTKLPPMLDPNAPPEPTAAPGQASGGLTATVGDTNRRDPANVQQTLVSKATKAREDVVASNDPELRKFLTQQRDRVVDNLRETLPRTKAMRGEWAGKADPEWWNADREDRLLKEALSGLYVQAARGSLQVVADTVDLIIPNRAVGRIVDDLLTQGGSRIKGINDTTLLAVQKELAEGTRRGYSLAQMIEGVPAEEYRGIRDLTVFDDARAEVITRTETMLSYNRAALDAYKEFQVTHVIAYDGDKDDLCAARDGREFTVEEAFEQPEHPNGTLDWAPVVDKAAHPDRTHYPPETDLSRVQWLVDAIKAPAPVINNFMEAAKAPDVHMDAPVITVNTPETVVPPANVSVTVPEREDHTAELIEAIKGQQPIHNTYVEAAKTPDVTVEGAVLNVKPAQLPPVDTAPFVEALTDLNTQIETLTKRKPRILRDKDGRIAGIGYDE